MGTEIFDFGTIFLEKYGNQAFYLNDKNFFKIFYFYFQTLNQ